MISFHRRFLFELGLSRIFQRHFIFQRIWICDWILKANICYKIITRGQYRSQLNRVKILLSHVSRRVSSSKSTYCLHSSNQSINCINMTYLKNDIWSYAKTKFYLPLINYYTGINIIFMDFTLIYFTTIIYWNYNMKNFHFKKKTLKSLQIMKIKF